jgi:putative ABC transport system ATP-binding protein
VHPRPRRCLPPRRDDLHIDVAARQLFTFDHVGLVSPAGDTAAARARLVDVTGEIASGGVTVIVGPSGSGKSSLLRLCNRLEVADRGVVRFHDDDVAGMDPLVLRRRVGMVFQTPTPFAGTVLDNLCVGRPDLGLDEARGVLDRVDLDPSFLARPATELSGGEAQRVCLARTLVTGPEVLLMDEPTSSVDPQATLALEHLARALVRSGVDCIWVTHDLAQMRRLATRVLVVLDGCLAHAAPLADLDRRAPEAVSRFLRDPSAVESAPEQDDV